MGLEKYRKLSDLAEDIARLKEQGRRIVFTNGCFDLLHAGHIRYLRQAASLGDDLVVAVNSDASVRRLKGPTRPILPEDERTELLCALEMVHFVVLFDEDTPYEVIRALVPDVLVKGGDWTPDQIVGKDVVEGAGGRVLSLPFVEGKSTTGVIRKVLES